MKKICLVLVAFFVYAEAAYGLVGMQAFLQLSYAEEGQ